MSDVYTIITDKIIAEMEKGIIPWRKPWTGSRSGAFNRVSGKPYSILNQILLKHAGEYATWKQWKDAGGTIKEGEKAEIVTFWKLLPVDPDQDVTASGDDEKKPVLRPVLRYYKVFHISQVEGVEPLPTPEDDKDEFWPVSAADAMIYGYIKRENITVRHATSDRAYYSPTQDLISMPATDQFPAPQDYYTTLAHEAIHSTGHPIRLNRFAVANASYKSDDSYGREELVAELGACFMMNRLGIDTSKTFENSVAYLQSWLSALRDDKKLIVIAAAQAEKAVNYISGGENDHS